MDNAYQQLLEEYKRFRVDAEAQINDLNTTVSTLNQRIALLSAPTTETETKPASKSK